MLPFFLPRYVNQMPFDSITHDPPACHTTASFGTATRHRASLVSCHTRLCTTPKATRQRTFGCFPHTSFLTTASLVCIITYPTESCQHHARKSLPTCLPCHCSFCVVLVDLCCGWPGTVMASALQQSAARRPQRQSHLLSSAAQQRHRENQRSRPGECMEVAPPHYEICVNATSTGVAAVVMDSFYPSFHFVSILSIICRCDTGGTESQ